jgi:hypothetical protein
MSAANMVRGTVQPPIVLYSDGFDLVHVVTLHAPRTHHARTVARKLSVVAPFIVFYLQGAGAVFDCSLLL